MKTSQNPKEMKFLKVLVFTTGLNFFRNFWHCLVKSESMSELSDFSTTEGRNELGSFCFFSSINVLVSGTISVEACVMMGFDCSTDWRPNFLCTPSHFQRNYRWQCPH